MRARAGEDANLLEMGTTLRTRQMIHQLPGHSKTGVENGVFSPDRKLFATGDWARTARLWDVQSGQLKRVFGIDSRLEGSGTAVAFSRGEKILFTDAAWVFRAFSVDTGALPAEFPGDRGWVRFQAPIRGVPEWIARARRRAQELTPTTLRVFVRFVVSARISMRKRSAIGKNRQ
jgi:WD40 domain-containing protein